MRTGFTVCIVPLLLALVPPLAIADPITISLLRLGASSASVAVRGEDVEGDDGPPDGALVFTQNVAALGLNAAAGTASLASALSQESQRLNGTGATEAIAQSPVAGDGTNAGALGDVSILWHFRLEETHLFDFDGDFAASAVQFGRSTSSASWRISLSGTPDGAPRATFFSGAGSSAERLTGGGALRPGLYAFEFFTRAVARADEGNASGATSFAFTLDVNEAATPTPEPSTLLLLGGGMLALLRSRRRASQLPAFSDERPGVG